MATRGQSGIDTGSILVAGSTVVVVIGALLGWITASMGGFQAGANGIDLFNEASPIFNGVVTIVLGIVATALALLAPDNEGASVLAALLGIGVVVIAATFIVAPATALGGGLGGSLGASMSSTGIGVIVTILGGLGITVGGILAYSN